MATLLDSGALWIDDDFLLDSLSVFAVLASTVAWDDRIRARKAASFGQPYNYSGILWPQAPFPTEVARVLKLVSARLGYQPNNCLAHYYPDGNSVMGYHADATDELVPATGIAVVSLGADRTLSFRSQRDKNHLEHYLLRSGSLLFMSPEMQLDWKHGLLPEESVRSGRISLTFRYMKTC